MEIHITLSKKATQDFEDLRKKLGVDSISEVIRISLATTKYLEEQKEKGYELILRRKESEIKIVKLS